MFVGHGVIFQSDIVGHGRNEIKEPLLWIVLKQN